MMKESKHLLGMLSLTTLAIMYIFVEGFQKLQDKESKQIVRKLVSQAHLHIWILVCFKCDSLVDKIQKKCVKGSPMTRVPSHFKYNWSLISQKVLFLSSGESNICTNSAKNNIYPGIFVYRKGWQEKNDWPAKQHDLPPGVSLFCILLWKNEAYNTFSCFRK